MRLIGISNRTRYWQQYVFDRPPSGYTYRRMIDIPWYSLGVHDQFLAHTKYFFPFRHADLFHTYNGIVANGSPWVIEVESYLPRYGAMAPGHVLYRWALRRLASPDCRGLVFTSRSSLESNVEKLASHGIDPNKAHVIYRAVERYDPGPRDPNVFTILFAGNGFYRKGGIELLKAFERMGRQDARLVVISRLEVDWRIYPDKKTIEWAERTIAEDPRIEHHSNLAHDQVIEAMRRVDVFVGTTFDDPFMNTALEAMATGLPVIGSQHGSMPEIVEDGVNGALIDVLDTSSDDIADRMMGELVRLMDDRDLLAQQGSASLVIARERFDIEQRNKALGALYDSALAT